MCYLNCINFTDIFNCKQCPSTRRLYLLLAPKKELGLVLFMSKHPISQSRRFRPLSLDVPKPLFPVAGLPIVQHHIEACSKVWKLDWSFWRRIIFFLQVPDIKEVLLLGFYPASEMASFVADMNKEHQEVFFHISNSDKLKWVANALAEGFGLMCHLAPGVCEIFARICSSWHSWRPPPLPWPDQSWESRCLCRHERRRLCWVPPVGDAGVPLFQRQGGELGLVLAIWLDISRLPPSWALRPPGSSRWTMVAWLRTRTRTQCSIMWRSQAAISAALLTVASMFSPHRSSPCLRWTKE